MDGRGGGCLHRAYNGQDRRRKRAVGQPCPIGIYHRGPHRGNCKVFSILLPFKTLTSLSNSFLHLLSEAFFLIIHYSFWVKPGLMNLIVVPWAGILFNPPSTERLCHNVITRLSSTPGRSERPGSPRGSETRGVLEGLRYSPEEISTLFEEHIVESSEADVHCLKE